MRKRGKEMENLITEFEDDINNLKSKLEAIPNLKDILNTKKEPYTKEPYTTEQIKEFDTQYKLTYKNIMYFEELKKFSSYSGWVTAKEKLIRTLVSVECIIEKNRSKLKLVEKQKEDHLKLKPILKRTLEYYKESKPIIIKLLHLTDKIENPEKLLELKITFQETITFLKETEKFYNSGLEATLDKILELDSYLERYIFDYLRYLGAVTPSNVYKFCM